MVLLPVFIVACQSHPSPQQGTEYDKGSQQASISTVYNGTYIFDTEAYKKQQLKQDPAAYIGLSSADIDKMMRIFKPYRIEIKGDVATASFANDAIVGKVSQHANLTNETHLKFTPENKPELMFIINGDTLVLDSHNKDSDKMFFKKEP